ncbi:MAG TPA: 5'/3'-nucleotidase SurE [Peptococcaceae bacterium]|nr:MAG: 5'-nucleotidase SurE [Clostridia bacterium 41_269]HBT19977.1 5'/3'-nucleotidase SurE [Peptococcaceae bacterium]
MKILITNDDGIQAQGLITLYKYLSEFGTVNVVAPERERSAIGHGITMHKPLRVYEYPIGDTKKTGYAVSGTPADCVKLALEALLPEPPDIIISGINWGANLGTDVLYSGTVSAAIEGTINGIKSMAVSLDDRRKIPDFSVAAKFVNEFLKIYIKHDMPSDTLLNINIPDVPWNEIKGVKITKLGRRRYIDTVERRKDPRGREYFWLAGRVNDHDMDPETDTYAIKENYISICPVHFDLTNYEAIKEIKTWCIIK